MLANGATLAYRTTSSGNYTNLAGLKELPDLGVDAEKIENTVLSDSVKQYEMGIGDAGDLVYKFKYVNGAATDSYPVLKNLEANKTLVYFKETLFDGTETEFSGYIAVKRTGGGVNSVVEFDLAIALQSDFTTTNPFS